MSGVCWGARPAARISEAVEGREARPPLLGSSQALPGGKVGTRVPDLLILQKMLEILIFMGKLPVLKCGQLIQKTVSTKRTRVGVLQYQVNAVFH